MLEVKQFIEKLKKSEIPLSIRTMEKELLHFRRWVVSGWHAKRKFTKEAKMALKEYAKTFFIS